MDVKRRLVGTHWGIFIQIPWGQKSGIKIESCHASQKTASLWSIFNPLQLTPTSYHGMFGIDGILDMLALYDICIFSVAQCPHMLEALADVCQIASVSWTFTVRTADIRLLCFITTYCRCTQVFSGNWALIVYYRWTLTSVSQRQRGGRTARAHKNER